MKNSIVSLKKLGCIERNVNFQNLLEHQTRFSKQFMINVSFESCSKIIIHLDEVSHVTTKLIRLYWDHQFVKLPKVKYIVRYLHVNVSTAPSCTSRKKVYCKTKSTFADDGIKLKNSGARLGLLREPLYILYRKSNTSVCSNRPMNVGKLSP